MNYLISKQAVLDIIFENVEYFVDNESALNFASKIKKISNSDYVPKETIKEVIDRCKEEFIKTFNERIEKRLTELNVNIPSAEQETGHWVVNEWGNISCSECGCAALYDKVYPGESVFGKAIRVKSTFCPTCGAKMEV